MNSVRQAKLSHKQAIGHVRRPPSACRGRSTRRFAFHVHLLPPPRRRVTISCLLRAYKNLSTPIPWHLLSAPRQPSVHSAATRVPPSHRRYCAHSKSFAWLQRPTATWTSRPRSRSGRRSSAQRRCVPAPTTHVMLHMRTAPPPSPTMRAPLPCAWPSAPTCGIAAAG